MSESPGNARVGHIGDVEAQLAELWREFSTGEQAVIRACMLNLVVVCDGPDELAETSRLVARVSEEYPARALVVAPRDEAGRDPALDAYVSAHCHRGPGGSQVCSEQVTLETTGAARELVRGSVLRLLVGDCPVYTWWRRPRLAGDPLVEPLVEMSDRFVADSAAAAEPGETLRALSRIVDGDGPAAVGDLAWVRLEPWRELAAGLFDPAASRPYLDGLRRIELVTGGPVCAGGGTVAGAYLGGWLASRLGWTARRSGWQRADGTQVEVVVSDSGEVPRGDVGALRLEGEHDGRRAAFTAERPETGGEIVRVAVEMEGGCPPPFLRKLARLDPASLLCGYMELPAADPVFDAALATAALTLASPAGEAR